MIVLGDDITHCPNHLNLLLAFRALQKMSMNLGRHAGRKLAVNEGVVKLPDISAGHCHAIPLYTLPTAPNLTLDQSSPRVPASISLRRARARCRWLLTVAAGISRTSPISWQDIDSL